MLILGQKSNSSMKTCTSLIFKSQAQARIVYVLGIFLFLNLFYDKKGKFLQPIEKKRSRKYHVSCLVQLERLAQYLHCTAHCSCLEFILQNDESRQIFPHF